jgi:trans-L-3-hydroxyproline dehydratase
MFSDWNPPKNWKTISTLDAHTAGEPLRVITGGLPEIPGKTILAKRRFFQENLDHLRTGLIWEPRGHADMYGAVLTEPVTADGDFGVFFLHNQGYSTMCGHAIIAITTMVLDTGMIKKEGDSPVLRIDTPAGRVTATAHRQNRKVKEVSFLNVPSFVYKSDLEIDVPGIGRVRYDVAFGGAYYALCNASELGIGLEAKDYNQLIDWGKRIKHAVMETLEIEHPVDQELSFLYGTIFIGRAANQDHHSRNVCVFAEGEVDRSPTGTGVSARAALHYLRGELEPGQMLEVESILGTCFRVRVAETAELGPYPAVIPEVTGSASITGQHRFYFDPQDPLPKGFIFR